MNYTIDFKNFPLALKPIILNEGCILYRFSATSDPKNVEVPRFFSDYSIASQYDGYFGSGNKDIYECKLKKIKLLDIRLVKNYILELGINYEETISGNLRNLFGSFMDSFGFLSLQQQTNYQLENLISPLENYGYRNSEVSRDDNAVSLIKLFIGEQYDGYIAPEMTSINGTERSKLFNEICLFNPKECIKSTILEKNERLSEINKIIKLQDLIPTYATKKVRVGGNNNIDNSLDYYMKTDEHLTGKIYKN